MTEDTKPKEPESFQAFVAEMESIKDFARGCWHATRTNENDLNPYWIIYDTIQEKLCELENGTL